MSPPSPRRLEWRHDDAARRHQLRRRFLLFIFEFFLLFAWIWILISIIRDLFRDHELSGVAKAVWVFFLVFLPFFGVLLYLIVRGNGMRDRTIKAQVDQERDSTATFESRRTAGSPADELHKLNELKESGALSARGVRPGKVEVACLMAATSPRLAASRAALQSDRSNGCLRWR